MVATSSLLWVAFFFNSSSNYLFRCVCFPHFSLCFTINKTCQKLLQKCYTLMFALQFSVLHMASRRTYFSFALTKTTEFRLIYRSLVYKNIIWENLFGYTAQFMFIYGFYTHTHTHTHTHTYIYIYIYIHIRNTCERKYKFFRKRLCRNRIFCVLLH